MREKIDTLFQPAMQNGMLSKSGYQNGFKVFTPKLTGFPKCVKPFFKTERF